MSEAQETGNAGGGMMRFRRSNRHLPNLPKASAARQGDITRLAFTQLGGRDSAIAFLNTVDEALGGRPIDLATASDEGFASVEQAIARRAADA